MVFNSGEIISPSRNLCSVIGSELVMTSYVYMRFKDFLVMLSELFALAFWPDRILEFLFDANRINYYR